MLLTVLQQTSVDSCYFVSTIYSKLLSLICWGSGLFGLDLHLGRQMELLCIYMLFTVKKNLHIHSNTCHLHPRLTLRHTHKHQIHQRHLLWFFCVQAPDRGVGGVGGVIIILFMPGVCFNCILLWELSWQQG